MGYRDDVYNFVLVLHLIAVIVGFGPLVLNGVYAGRAKSIGGSEGLAINQASYAVSKIAEKSIYATFVFGVLLVILSDQVIEFSELWISLSFLLYFIAVGISKAVMSPAVKRSLVLQDELVNGGGAATAGGPPPQVAELEGLGKKMAITGGILNLMLVAIILLMVFKPGSELLSS